MVKYKLNKDELREHFNDQLLDIEEAIEKFDNGNEKKARQIALALRIICHDTQNSKSLLKQLNLNIFFLSNNGLYTPSNLLSSWTLLQIEFGPEAMSYKPNLELSQRVFFSKFDDWWNEIIFDDKTNVFTRKDIVSYIANQDGGAHVDPYLNEKYAKLVKHNSLGWEDENGTAPNNNPAYQAIRTIAYEFLTSIRYFNVGYSTRKKRKNTHFEVRFKDKNSRYKWSNTEMTFSPETENIISKDKQEDRVLYIQEFKNGDKKELYL